MTSCDTPVVLSLEIISLYDSIPSEWPILDQCAGKSFPLGLDYCYFHFLTADINEKFTHVQFAFASRK